MQSLLSWRVLRSLLIFALLGATAFLPSSDPLAPVPIGPLPAGVHNDTSTPFNVVSLPALIEHRYDGRDLHLDRVASGKPTYTRFDITYRSGPLRISGVMTVPTRPGRYPLLVVAHGYRPPAAYTSGAGSTRELEYLTSNGFVVLHPDYRNYGHSDSDRRQRVMQPLGYPEDVINAVLAVRDAGLRFVDDTRVGLLGRSMGGGVALNAVVARPDLFDAVVLHSPVSSKAADNFDRWVNGKRPLERRVVARYGAPDDNPDFWREASARSYLDRVDVPVQIHHGLADPVCPPQWSEATASALRAAGQDVELFEYPGEEHRFERGWSTLLRRTTDFFDDHLR